MIQVLSEGSISKVLVFDVQIRSAVQELSNGRPLVGTIHVSDVTFKPGGIVVLHVAKGLVTRVNLRESLCFFLNLGAMVIEMLACFCPGFPDYWLRISRWITCNWSHPSSILLVTHVMQDAWWSAERKGKRKREELRSHSRANRSGRISHDFTTYEVRRHTVFPKHLVLGGHRWICSQMSQIIMFICRSLFCKLHIYSCQAFSGIFASTSIPYAMMFQQLTHTTLCFVFLLHRLWFRYIHYP